MFELINSHQQEFIYLLNQPMVHPNNPVNPQQVMAQQQYQQQQQQQERPVLTEEDENNIVQLIGITGFDRNKC